MIKSIRNFLRLQREPFTVPRSTQDLMPVRSIWPDGIFLSRNGHMFSRTWRISDINYAVASGEDKHAMFLDTSAFINAAELGGLITLTVFNRVIDRVNMEQEILYPLKGDALDRLRRDVNGMLTEKVLENNAMEQVRFVTLSVHKKNIDEARAWLGRAGIDMTGRLGVLGSVAEPLDANRRLRLYRDLFRPGAQGGVAFDIRDAKEKGHSFLDAIAPDSYESLDGNTVKLGERYARTLFLREYATYIKDTMISEFCDLPKTMMLSLNILPVPTDEALAEVERRVMGVDTDITHWQRSQNRGGNFSAEIPPHLERARKESRELEDDLTTRDQRLFFGFVSILHTAGSRRELDEDTESLTAAGRKHMCQLAPMTFRQIEGLQTTAPFGVAKVSEEEFRTLNTESLTVLIPWKAQEIRHKGGAYFGQNAISKNVILIDQTALLNGNSIILGTSGSGKSMIAKAGLMDKILNTDDDVFILDPEAEYGRIARAVGGSVVRVAPDSENRINALDMTEGYDDGADGIRMKSDFILSLCEQCVGMGKIEAGQKSLIDRAVANIYRDYIKGGYRGEAPTLRDFHAELLRFSEPPAQDIALAMELFTTGSLNIFAHQTNVDTANRIIVYDIRDLGRQLKTVGMLVVLDSVFNRLLRNRARGRRTWIVVDELYLMFSNEYSATYFYELWKRIRKYGGFATGITQNVTDMLQSHTARSMLSNSEFLVMLNQSGTDRMELGKLLEITDTQLSAITNVQPGRGLIKCGSSIVPFEHVIPKGTEYYGLLTTKLGEV